MGRQWCRTDPIVKFTHATRPTRTANIFAYAPVEIVGHVVDELEFTVTAPPGYTCEVLFTDEGFNGEGENVTITATDTNLVKYDDGDFQIRVVLAPLEMDSTSFNALPLELHIDPSHVEGKTKRKSATVGAGVTSTHRI